MAAEVLTDEQLEELASYLRGTHSDLADGLAELSVNIRSMYHSRIEEELADKEEIEQCCTCGLWTFSEALSQNEDGELTCSNCMVELDNEEDW